MDRTKALQSGFTQLNVASNLLGVLERQLPDVATVLARSAKRGDLQRDHADAAASDSPPSTICGISRSASAYRAAVLKSWATWPAPAAAAAWRSLSHYNIQRAIDIFGSVQGRDLGGVAADINRDRRRQPQGSAARIAADRPRPDRNHADVLPGTAGRIGPGHRPGLPADRGELPVLAGSVHHHHGAARPLWPASCCLLFATAHHDERARADGRDHERGRRDGQQHSGGQLRQGTSGRAWRRRRWPLWKPASRASVRS